jgi:hypothetical protein
MTFYRHACGLLQHNITAEKGFGALIVVDTPALDDSGVSHAVEHLVFRRSAAFAQPESLFQLTALTDLSINASTHSNKTYYHCHSQSLQTCLLGLNYLLNGLLAPVFVAQDLQHEIYHGDCYGVMHRELSFQQVHQQRVIDRSDTSEKRCYQYGGDIELISQLNQQDVTRYHTTYYQAHKIQLITGSIESTLVASILESISYTDQVGAPYVPKSLPKNSHYEEDKQLLRWWIDSQFYIYFSSNYEKLRVLIRSYDSELVLPQLNLNNKQQFALDVIAPFDCCEKALSGALDSYILKNTEEIVTKEKAQQHKFSPEIIQLFNYYAARNPDSAMNLSAKSKQHTIPAVGRGNAYLLQKQPMIKQFKNTKAVSLLAVKNKVLKQLTPQLSEDKYQQSEYKHRPLPTVFTPLLLEAKEKLNQNSIAKVFCQDHCLILISISQEEMELGILTSFIMNAYPTFLSSRTQGHCYAIASHYIPEYRHLVFYSAFDVAPSLKLTIIIEALQMLSQDLQFITSCLPLAKRKLANADINDISVQAIAQFISNTIATNHVVVVEDN